jgi:hypothetical protein
MKSILSRFFILGIFVLTANSYCIAQMSCGTIVCDHLNDNAFWMINESQYGSKKLSDCNANASYNCHGFVMSYFEGGCTQPSWYNPVSAPYTCPNTFGKKYDTDWQNSGKYVRVCSEINANIAYYHLANSDTHSAVKEILFDHSFKYISKYGCNGPLVAHNLNGSFYHLVVPSQINTSYPTEFWTYIGPITGNPNIAGTAPVTFGVIDSTGINYSWAITNGNSKIYVYSGGNQAIVTLIPVHTGSATLQLSVSSSCGSVKTQQINLNVNICLDGTYDNAGIYNQVLNTVNHVSTGGVAIRVSCSNATTITWQKTSGNINGYFPDGQSVSFNMTSGGSISLLITAKNGSTTIGSRTVTFYN